MSLNSRLKAIWIIGQREAFYRQREFWSLDVQRKKLLTIDILVTPKNGDRKNHVSIRITSRIRKWNQLSQFR